MTSRQTKIQEDTHFRIMSILQENPDFTQRELANKIGMSVGGLNYCFKALIDKGLLKIQNFSSSKNKFKYVYLLTPMGIEEKVALTTRIFSRKMEEYEALKLEIEALKSEVVLILYSSTAGMFKLPIVSPLIALAASSQVRCSSDTICSQQTNLSIGPLRFLNQAGLPTWHSRVSASSQSS